MKLLQVSPSGRHLAFVHMVYMVHREKDEMLVDNNLVLFDLQTAGEYKLIPFNSSIGDPSISWLGDDQILLLDGDILAGRVDLMTDSITYFPISEEGFFLLDLHFGGTALVQIDEPKKVIITTSDVQRSLVTARNMAYELVMPVEHFQASDNIEWGHQDIPRTEVPRI